MKRKMYNNETGKWENVEYKENEIKCNEKSVTHIDSWKPSLDSIRQAFQRGLMKQKGVYQYNEDGEENKEVRAFDNWEKPDLTEVDDKIKQEQKRNRTKKTKAENEKLAKEYEKKRKENEEKEREEIKKVLTETIKMAKE